MTSQRGVRKIVKELGCELVEVVAVDSWEAIVMLARTEGGIDNGEKLVRYHRLDYEARKEAGDVQACMYQDDSVQLWQVIVEHGKRVWNQFHAKEFDGSGYIYQLRLDSSGGMEGMYQVLKKAGLIMATIIAGQVVRYRYHEKVDLKGNPVEYEFVNFCEKKVEGVIVVPKSGGVGGVKVKKHYAWQLWIEMLEHRMDERANWIRRRAMEIGVNLNEVHYNAGIEVIRDKWNKELLVHSKPFRNMCLMYLSELHSELVRKYVQGEIGMRSQLKKNPVMLDGHLVEYEMSKNTGEGPKVESLEYEDAL